MRALKIGGAVLALGMVATLALAALAHKDARSTHEEATALAAAVLREHAPQFRDDEKQLSSLPLFAPRSGKVDAGAFLNPRVTWVGDHPSIAAYRATQGNAASALALPEELKQRLSEWSKAWPAHAADVDLSGLDFQWMRELARYDHWDIDTGSPIAWMKPFSWISAPLPSYVDLQHWAKLRLLKGEQHDDIVTAAAEVRELARLVASTELLLGDMMAISILKQERRAYERARARERSTAGWQPLEDEDLDRWRRVAYGFQAFADLHAPSDVVGDVWTAPDARVGRCGAIRESYSGALMHRHLAEEGHAEGYARLTQILAATQGECQVSALRAQWAAYPDEDGPLKLELDGCTAVGAVERPFWCVLAPAVLSVAGVKTAVGERLLRLGTPEWFKHYSDSRVR